MSAVRIWDRFKNLLDVNWAGIADGQFLKRSGTTIIGGAPSGTGDVVGPAASVDNELPLYSGTTGKLIKRCGLSGFVKAATNGAATAQTQMGAADLSPAAITGQTAKTSIVDGDQFLMYDSVSTQLRKVAGNVVIPVGSVVQTVYAEFLTEINTQLQASPPFTITTGVQVLSAALTPIYSNSKVLIRAAGGATLYKTTAPITGSGTFFLCVSGTTNLLAEADLCGYSDNEIVQWGLQYMHTPGAGAKTYSIRMVNFTKAGATMDMYANGYNFVSAGYKPVTSLVIQEIKQ